MADLQLAPAAERTPLKIILIAAAVLVVVFAAVFWFNPHKVADITVPHEDLFSPHTEYTSLAPKKGMHVVGDTPAVGSASEDDLYVVATVHIDNHLRLPVFVSGVSAAAVMKDGSSVEPTVVHASDLARLEQSFPEIAKLTPHPITNDQEASPKGSLEGQVVLLFPTLTQADWKAKQSAQITIAPVHQEPMTVPLP